MNSSRVSAVFLLFAATIAAQGQSVPSTINYQGRLTDNSPSQIPINTTVPMQFEIWDAPSGGGRLWQEPATPATTSVTVTNGIFNVLLGASAGAGSVPIPVSLFNGGTARYLQIIVNNETLTPRQTITATGYANQAQSAALAVSATLAANSTQLGGVPSGSYQLATYQICGGNDFIKIIANGSAACATPATNNLTPPVSLSSSNAAPIFSATNTGTGNAGNFTVNNSVSGSSALWVESNDTGTALSVVTTGSGAAANFTTTSIGSTSDTLSVFSFGSGSAASFEVNHPGAVAPALSVITDGNTAGYFQGKVLISGKATSWATVAADPADTLATKSYVDVQSANEAWHWNLAHPTFNNGASYFTGSGSFIQRDGQGAVGTGTTANSVAGYVSQNSDGVLTGASNPGSYMNALARWDYAFNPAHVTYVLAGGMRAGVFPPPLGAGYGFKTVGTVLYGGVISMGGAETLLDLGVTLSPGKYRFRAVVRSATSIEFFVNGVSRGTMTGTTIPDSFESLARIHVANNASATNQSLSVLGLTVGIRD